MCKWFPTLSALVVGPGLGRDPALQAVAALVVERAISASLPCVIDADGLRIVLDRPERVRGSPWTVLTPNKPEYGRLVAALGAECTRAAAEAAREHDASTHGVSEQPEERSTLLGAARVLGGPVVVRKGPTDLVCDGSSVLANCEAGSLKRSGGQGDVLAGTIATLLGWARTAAPRLPLDAPSAPVLAAYTGCVLTRRFSAAAFARHRRSMTAPDMIDTIGPVFEDFCPAEDVVE